MFKRLFIFFLILGVVPYLLSCRYAAESSQWNRVFFYTGVYLWVTAATFFEKRPFQFRVWAGLSGFYGLGLFSLYDSGPVGSTIGYLICFSIFSVIFSGARAGLITLVISTFTLLCFGWFHFEYGHGVPYLKPDIVEWDPKAWTALTGTFVLLTGSAVTALSPLIKTVENTVKENRFLIQNTPDIIWDLDQNFNITSVNPSIYPILGYSQREMFTQPISLFLPEFSSRIASSLKKKEVTRLETVMIHKDGRRIDVDFIGSKGSSRFKEKTYQGVIRDISQKKRRERKQQQLKEELVKAEKLKALGIIAGSVAHDLNNVLSGIATYPEVLLMNDKIDPEIRKGLTIIKDSGQKASAVVSDLLTVSRGSTAEMEILNLNRVIKRYADAHDFKKIRETYPGVGIEIQTDPELLNIKGSYIHIEKIIMNLVLNGVEEVSHRPGGNVCIATTNLFFDAVVPGYKGVEPGEYCLLQITDNGTGINKKQIPKIFDPFFSNKEMGKSGTGLGLTVVWNAVRDHRGYIFVRSTAGGTTFEVLIPAVRLVPDKKNEDRSFEEIKGRGQMILVVDDLKEQQNIALVILDSLGYRAKAVDNGYDAVQFIKSQPVDLVILDMIMAPSISGLDTYRLIKDIRPNQKAVIASGYSKSDDVFTAQELGAGAFVKKPYTVMDMGIAIKEELEK
ncbi:MAG: response regulator [Desulfobacterales bacterium]|nr:response regulator [Desulfobacterales bacterium]